jgi:hypothetical protein
MRLHIFYNFGLSLTWHLGSYKTGNISFSTFHPNIVPGHVYKSRDKAMDLHCSSVQTTKQQVLDASAIAYA